MQNWEEGRDRGLGRKMNRCIHPLPSSRKCSGQLDGKIRKETMEAEQKLYGAPHALRCSVVLLCHQREATSLNRAEAQRSAQALPSDRLGFSFQSRHCLAMESKARKFHLCGTPHGMTPTLQGHVETA